MTLAIRRRSAPTSAAGRLAGITAGLAPGFVQANLAVLPKEQAYDFLLFCQRNPRPCPLIEVTDVGLAGAASGWPRAPTCAPTCPRYRIYKDGVLADEVTDVTPFWRDDLVAFLLGCSFTFEWALLDAGIPMRHIDEGKNVAMWKTSIACRPAGPFHGPMVVSMRPIPTGARLQGGDGLRALPQRPRRAGAHRRPGGPRHRRRRQAGLGRLRWASAPGEVPVFWACGVTPQAVALASKPAFMITHSPGHMFITDLPNHALAAI